MFIAGPYTATYNNATLGVTEEGWELEYTFSGDPIVGDNLGDSIQDHIYRGGNCFLSAILCEWDLAGVQEAFWPYEDTFGKIGHIGANVLDHATNLSSGQALVLSRSGSDCRHSAPAPGAGPVTITVRYGILAMNTPVRQLFASRHRKVGVRMQAYPYVPSSNVSASDPPASNSAAVWFSAV